MALSPLTPFLPRNPSPNPQIRAQNPNFRTIRAPFAANSAPNSTRLVTFLGKGGSGKTSAAVLAAKYYAKEGLRTCLVIHSQDPTAEQLMGCKIGSSPATYSENLSAVRLQSSKIVGEELGVLPGMDSILSALALGKLVDFIPSLKNNAQREFDIVVYDGISTEETLRLIGATERAKWYLKYIRSMAEKTDIGRVTSPSLLKLVYESLRLNSASSQGKTSMEIWSDIEQILEKASISFSDPSKIGCYLVMDPSRSASVASTLHYWGCAIQAGTQICGAFGVPSQTSLGKEEITEKVSPLNYALVPYFSTDHSLDWDAILNSISNQAKHLLSSTNSPLRASVRFDPSQKSVTLFMPGFDKSEIKLYQYRGGAELLVEAGDQRRIIQLPRGMQGKVGGAKFIDRNLVVTLR